MEGRELILDIGGKRYYFETNNLADVNLGEEVSMEISGVPGAEEANVIVMNGVRFVKE